MERTFGIWIDKFGIWNNWFGVWYLGTDHSAVIIWFLVVLGFLVHGRRAVQISGVVWYMVESLCELSGKLSNGCNVNWAD